MHCSLTYVSHFFTGYSFIVAVFDRFFLFGRQKKWSLVALDRWSSYTVMIAWAFACADSALVVLEEWWFDRDGRLNRFDCFNFRLKGIWIIDQRKTLCRQRTSTSDCLRKYTADINILTTSRNNRKIMHSIRVTAGPSTRIRKQNQYSQFRWTYTKVMSIKRVTLTTFR